MDRENVSSDGEYSSVVTTFSNEEEIELWKRRIAQEMPKYMLGPLFQALNDFGPNDTDFGTFQFRYNLRSHITIWILIYSLIFAFGLILNIKFIFWYNKTRKHLCYAHSFVFDLILGNSVNDLVIKDLIVLPVSFLTMTGVHWVLGPHFCKFFPIIQDSCFYSSSLIILGAFYFRYKQISNCTFNSANKLIEYQSEVKKLSSIPVLIVAFGISLVGVIPHTVYIDYADLGYYVGPVYNDTGICAVNTENRFMDYVKYLFLLFYVIPVVISFSYFSKTIDIIEKWIQSGEEYATTKRIHIHRGSAVEASIAPVVDDDDYDDDDDDDDDVTSPTIYASKRTSLNTDEVSNDTLGTCEGTFQRGDKRRESRKGNSNPRNTRSSMMMTDGYNASSPRLNERDEDVNKADDTLHMRLHVNKTSDMSSPNDGNVMDDTLSSLPGRQAIERRSFRSNSGCPRLTFNVTSDGNKYTNTLTNNDAKMSPRCEVSSDSRLHVSINENSGHSSEYRRNSNVLTNSNDDTDDVNHVSFGDKGKLRSNLDIEQSLQKVMSRILLFQSILLLPFNILRFAKHIIPEKSDLNNVYDYLFLVLVGLQFSTILLIPFLIMNIFATEFDHRRAQLDELKNSPLVQIERNRTKRQAHRDSRSHDRSRSSLTVDHFNGNSDSRKMTSFSAAAATAGRSQRQRAQSTFTPSLSTNTGSNSVLQPRRPSAVVNSSVNTRRNTTSSFHRKPSYAITSTSVHHASSNVPSASPLSSTGYPPVTINVKGSNSNVNFVDVNSPSLNVNSPTAGNMIGKISSASSSSITGLSDQQRRASPSLTLANQGNYLQAENMGLRRKSYQQLNLPSNQQMASGTYGHIAPMYQQPMQSSLSRGPHHRTQSVRVTSYAMRDQDHMPHHRQMANGQSAGRLSLAGLGFESSTLISNLPQRGYPQSEL